MLASKQGHRQRQRQAQVTVRVTVTVLGREAGRQAGCGRDSPLLIYPEAKKGVCRKRYSMEEVKIVKLSEFLPAWEGESARAAQRGEVAISENRVTFE